MEELQANIKRLFYADKLMETLDLLTEAEATLSETDVAELNQMEEVQVLRDDVRDAERCLDLLSDYSVWSRVRDEDNIVTFCRNSTTEFLFRGEVIVHAPIFVLLAIFSEEDLLPGIFPNLSAARKLHSFTPYRGLYTYEYKLPWPIHNREFITANSVFPIEESKSCLILERTPSTSEYLGFSVPQPAQNVVRMHISTSCVNLMYIEAGLTQVTLIGSVNPNIPLIPTSLINYVSKQEAFEMMRRIRDAADHYEGGPYQRRVEERTEYYSALREELDGYIRLFT